jgi:hypothetical protein
MAAMLELQLLQHTLSGVVNGVCLCVSSALLFQETLFCAVKDLDENCICTELKTAVQLVLNGRYSEALLQPPIQELLCSRDSDDIEGPEDYFTWLQNRLCRTKHEALHEKCVSTLHTSLLAIVACLNIFMQHNLTGYIHDGILLSSAKVFDIVSLLQALHHSPGTLSHRAFCVQSTRQCSSGRPGTEYHASA